MSIGSTNYNLLYCISSDGASFGLVAWSRSGNAFSVTEAGVSDYSFDIAGRATTCPRLVSPYVDDSSRYQWLYNNSAGWVAYL